MRTPPDRRKARGGFPGLENKSASSSSKPLLQHNTRAAQALTAHLHCDGRDRYAVVFDGERIVTGSRDPEPDAARALLARGVTGKLVMLDGKTHRPRTIINIARAAKLRTVETGNAPRFRRYEAYAQRPPAGERRAPGINHKENHSATA